MKTNTRFFGLQALCESFHKVEPRESFNLSRIPLPAPKKTRNSEETQTKKRFGGPCSKTRTAI
jgi:hypothetical protein